MSLGRIVPWCDWQEWTQVGHWLLSGEEAEVQQGLDRVRSAALKYPMHMCTWSWGAATQRLTRRRMCCCAGRGMAGAGPGPAGGGLHRSPGGD